jgi:hypothetical protein
MSRKNLILLISLVALTALIALVQGCGKDAATDDTHAIYGATS